jgi:hypothetical protein
MFGNRELIGAGIMVAGIFAVAFAANRALDALDIANESAATIEQRKERARERQWDWDHYRERRSEEETQNYRTAAVGKPDKMCADPRVMSLAKGLINDQYPSAAKMGKLIADLNAARPKKSIEDEWKYIEQDRTLWTSLLPRPEAQKELNELETRAAKLKERERLEKEGGGPPSAPPQPIMPDNEVIVSGEPYPIEYDRDLKRVACRVQFQIAGPAYETINALRGNALNNAIYTVQPGQNDWIVELLSASELN